MVDANAARDRKLFAPTPELITVVIDGQPVETALFSFMDLPAKEAEAVYHLEGDVPPAADFGAFLANRREVVRRLCPQLAPEHVEALVPRQLLEVIAASYPPRPAEGAAGAASPSPSAPSTTPSPSGSAGAP
jgi:hypothetical protein